MKKSKIYGLLCGAAMMLLSATPVLAAEEWVTVEGVEGGKIEFDAETGRITDCSVNVTNAVIPDEINGVAVTGINYYAFEHCENLTNVELPEGLTYIGGYAFYDCTSLTSIGIPGGVETIEENTFSGCTSLETVEIAEGVTSIDEDAFSVCINLEKVNIPSTVTSIGSYAFEDCTSLTSIEIPGGVETIEEYTFSGCENLKTVEIAEGVTSINEDAFSGCTNLEKVNIPSTVTSMGRCYGGYYDENDEYQYLYYGVFSDCPKLISAGSTGSGCSIEYGWTETIPGYAFSGCTSLISIEMPDAITRIGVEAFSGCTSLISIEMPDAITSIGESAFSGCTSLTSIELPGGVKSIESYTFSGCENLKTVEIAEGVTSIDEDAFSGCINLEKVNIPSTVTSMGWVYGRYYDERYYGVFSDCPKLISAGPTGSGCSIEYGWTETIPEYAFVDCTGLISVEIPDNTTSIGVRAFSGCTSLTSIEIPGGVETIKSYAFSGCENLKTVEIAEGVTSIEDSAFTGCTNLEKVNIPSTVTSMGWDYGGYYDENDEYQYRYYGAFSGCPKLISAGPTGSGCNIEFAWKTDIPANAFYGHDGLTSVEIPAGIVNIEEDAFIGCTNLEKVVIPSTVVEIDGDGSSHGASIFDGCTKLTSAGPTGSGSSIEFGWTIRIPDEIFRYCDGLTSVTLPEGIVSIGNSVFSGCSNLKDVNLPSTINLVGGYAFSSCTSLTNIELPDGITSLGGCVFYDSGLTSVKLPAKITNISYELFAECEDLVTVEIPYGVTSIEGYAFSDCTSLTDIKIPFSVTSIDYDAFYNCDSLTDMEIPASVTYIGGSAFADCDGLKVGVIPASEWSSYSGGLYSECDGLITAEIDAGVSYISSNAFYECLALKTVYIPASVTKINESAFEWCSNITDVYYGGTQAQWNAIEIAAGNEELKMATIHYGSEETGINIGFEDVEKEQFYYGPMVWAVDRNITTGYTATTFAPNQNCTRAQIVTFLWRAMGEPKAANRSHRFTDVDNDGYYYDAMLWAVEKGITNGYTETTFAPDTKCTRGQIVTFIYRAMNKPASSIDSHPFTDIDHTQYYYEPMLWAVGENITTGYTATTFAPDNACTRGQIVTFLYRALY